MFNHDKKLGLTRIITVIVYRLDSRTLAALFSFGTFDFFLFGLIQKIVCVVHITLPKRPVQNSLAKQNTGAKRLLS